jgi:hypothetical protein
MRFSRINSVKVDPLVHKTAVYFSLSVSFESSEAGGVEWCGVAAAYLVTLDSSRLAPLPVSQMLWA